MEIVGNNLSSLNSGNSVSNVHKRIVGNKTASENSNHNPELKERLKEAATEMLKDLRVPGEWKDKKGLEETTDNTMGGDIRYALTTKNIDFLKRLRRGPLTVSELREVTYKIRELERTMAKNPDLSNGKIINTKT